MVEEPESSVLEAWLTARGPNAAVVSSELARIEVLRMARRSASGGAADRARMILGGVDLVPMTGTVVDVASEIGDPLLRSLDAIHLATALSLGPALETMVVYDHRLADAATNAGLSVDSPGR